MRTDLEVLAKHEGIAVREAKTPGGGYYIRLTDPDGNEVDVIAGQERIRAESLANESFAGALLDYPSYTRPPVFRGVSVPEVLLSGDHRRIEEWRREQSRARTHQAPSP